MRNTYVVVRAVIAGLDYGRLPLAIASDRSEEWEAKIPKEKWIRIHGKKSFKTMEKYGHVVVIDEDHEPKEIKKRLR